MSKVVPETPAAEPTTVTSAPRKPFSVKVGEPIHVAFNIAVHLARQGYCFSDGPIEFAPNGYAFFELVRGDPQEYVINKANESVEVSALHEEQARTKAIRDEAKRLVEAEKREALEKQVAALKVEQARQIAELEKATAAAIAAL